MADISKIRAVVIEKHEMVLNQLTKLSHEDLIKLLASFSSIIANLDKAQAEDEAQCNKLIISEMERDPRATFSKAEAILKASDIYLTYKNTLSLKQFASRDLNIAKMHMQYLLKSKIDTDEESESGEN